MVIRSLENDKIKSIVKLQKKKYRDLTDTYVVEGEHLVRELYKEGLIKEIIAVEGVLKEFDVHYTFISEDVMKKISTMDSFCSILAVCNKKKYKDVVGNRFLFLENIQDPGNLGTIIRSAMAFNIDMVFLSTNTVDLYNPKVLRSTQGIFCHIPIMRIETSEVVNYMKSNDIPLYGTDVQNGVDVYHLDKDVGNRFCLVMGNEGNGVSKEVLDVCDKNLYIPMNDKVESLNVAIACSILLYELGRFYE